MDTVNFVETQFPKLDFFTRQIVKVHGGRHPELSKVRELFEQLKTKAQAGNLDFRPEFTELETVTNNYVVPGDACEAYRATYELLEYLDQTTK